MSEETHYRPGLLFLSKPKGYQLILAQPQYHNFPDGSREETRPILVADFGAGGGNVLMSSEATTDEEGRPLAGVSVSNVPGYEFRAAVADIRGGVFDLDEYLNRMGLMDAEERDGTPTREIVARKVLKEARDPRNGDMWLFEPPVPEPPWATFEETHHLQIADLAERIGKLDETLAYLRYFGKFEGVQKQLEEKLRERQEAEALVAGAA